MKPVRVKTHSLAGNCGKRGYTCYPSKIWYLALEKSRSQRSFSSLPVPPFIWKEHPCLWGHRKESDQRGLTKHLPHTITFFFPFLFWKAERERDGDLLLMHSSNACNSWGWARLKQDAKNLTQGSHIAGRNPPTWTTTCYPQGCALVGSCNWRCSWHWNYEPRHGMWPPKQCPMQRSHSHLILWDRNFLVQYFSVTIHSSSKVAIKVHRFTSSSGIRFLKKAPSSHKFTLKIDGIFPC